MSGDADIQLSHPAQTRAGRPAPTALGGLINLR
jgi:hypothetical protein